MEARIGFRLDRLRWGEWIVGGASLALLIDVFLPWYSLRMTFSATSREFGAATSATGLQAHHIVGIFAIVCCLVGLLSYGLQATQRGPALPQTSTVITALLSLILIIGLLVRVVFDSPTVLVMGAPGVSTTKTDVAAVVGLFLAVLMFAGTYVSMRTDGSAAADVPQRIETLRITQRPA